MKIQLEEITVKELFDGYKDSGEDGVVGFGGKLNIRPKFQREFIYKDEQRDEVIRTIKNGFPLNIMYWALSDDGTYELLDGQQRTISICEYLQNNFAVKFNNNDYYFNSLPKEEQKKIQDYKLMIYICDGTEDEKLKWFEIINIGGAVLTKQELRNAIYCGSWTTDAKRYFSKINCAGGGLSDGYVSKKINRQELLEIAIKWIADLESTTIENYMSKHRHDENAKDLYEYFKNVINWTKNLFPNSKEYKKILDNQEWGVFYNTFHKSFKKNAVELEKLIGQLWNDDDVEKKTGIIPYIFYEDEKYLNIRAFSESQKSKAYHKCSGKCNYCKKLFPIEEMEADHITPWSEGGKTNEENLQMLCKSCNRTKGAK